MAQIIFWEKIPRGILKAIARMVYAHEHGHVFIEKILPHDALEIHDIDMISHHHTEQPAHIIDLLTKKLYEIGNYLNSPQDEIDTIIENLRKKRSPVDLNSDLEFKIDEV